LRAGRIDETAKAGKGQHGSEYSLAHILPSMIFEEF
jgi:hypothetical protein